MDTFMDKLAQKLTAQEMIKANAAADAEEMNKLRDQIQEYNECLDKLQKLIEEGSAKLENAKVDGAEVNRLVEEGINKIQAVQQDTQILEEMKQKLDEKLDGSNENVHKECVKVYRNVQAVVVEESAKQAEREENSTKKLQGKMGAILGISITALVISVCSIVLQILQTLQSFNIKLF